MSIQKLKSTLRRGSMFGLVAAFVVSAFAPATSIFADSLNPLTERSLTLSSSSPGWNDTDGSGNTTYAPPNSGANGKKTGNYFSFKVSTDTTSSPTIKAMSFQYCLAPAGKCYAPGNDATHGTDTATTSDLNVHYPSAQEISNTDFNTVIDSSNGNVKAVPGYTNNNPKYLAGHTTADPAEAAKNVAGNFIVIWDNNGTWEQSQGWTATTSNEEAAASPGTPTGQQNAIILQNSGTGFPAHAAVKVLFFATTDDYNTNPGEGAFFVKINTFKDWTALSKVAGSEVSLQDNIDSGNVIDGGVTVANVMNQSIQITTKVLETMQFSVGTVDPNTLTDTQLAATKLGAPQHGSCDIIQTALTNGDPENVLQLGDQGSESSLSVDHTYATHSYWRLSSNSSAGATVYYSGHTLSNTSGDEIKPIGVNKTTSKKGTEQFGLALSTKDTTSSTNAFDKASYAVDYSVDRATGKNYENAADTNDSVSVTGVDDSTLLDNGATHSGSWDYTNLSGSYHTPRLDPLVPKANYSDGAGKINLTDGQGGSTNAQFAFDPLSDTIPTAIADEPNQVVDCVTAKMRYIANMAATTPAGIYTTKVNYIAAPQY